MVDKYNGKDPLGLIAQCKATAGKNKWLEGKLIMDCWDEWDKHYGKPPFSFEAYVLTDSTRPMIVDFPPFLQFHHRPFYVGEGIWQVRAEKSSEFGRQMKDGYDRKTKMLREIHGRGGHVIPVRIGEFYTKQKAQAVERKLMHTIPLSFLEGNSDFNLCEIPLTASDCNLIYTPPIPGPLLMVPAIVPVTTTP